MVRSMVLLKVFGKWPRAAALLHARHARRRSGNQPECRNWNARRNARRRTLCPQAIRLVPWAILAFAMPGVAIDRPQLSGTVTAEGLRLNINGEASQPYTVEVSRDLKHWIPTVTTEPSRRVFPP